MLELSLCNELLAEDGLSLAAQCERAAALGYRGLELAPGTLSARPHAMSGAEWRAVRETVEAAGLRVTGLHWLLSPYPGLSIFDPATHAETQAVLGGLIDGCAALGGDVLVHGSPPSRRRPDGMSPEAALDMAADFFAPVAERAAAAGVAYCIEPLSPVETNFAGTLAEAVALVERVGNPAFRTMIDSSAAAQAEALPVADLIRAHVPTGQIAHVQLNESNRGAPGMGTDPFGEIVRALIDVGWDRPVAIEPFRTCIDGTVTAAIGYATIRAHEARP
ncbi:MAG: sugar phosphate isomerase/epimerase [Maritimibacter sp.]|nr:sugar phosphate isomerase/epimerase [Maritimibacter sp.]